MKTTLLGRILILTTAITMLVTLNLNAQSQFWVTGYLTSWSLNTGVHESGYGDGNLHKDSIDYNALTHIVMFAISLGSDGTIGFGNLSPGRQGPYNDFVHSKGKPIILSVGGAGNNAFATAIGSANRTTTVRNLLALRRAQRYDGFDIDMEPVNTSDTANLRLFIKQLYDSLQRESAYYNVAKKPLITAAIYNSAGFWASASPYLDQVNLMTYDFFGTWFGKSWHNNAPYGAASDVDIYNVAMTTVQSKMQRFLDAGIPRAKFGVGVDFNGYVWKGGLRNDGSGSGITAPRQTWTTAPTMTTGKEVTGYTLKKDWIDKYPSNVHYDAVAKVPYIGIDATGSANDYYITYQDTSTAREIVQLSKNSSLGGIIIWELGGGYYSAADFPGLAERHPMLQSIKRAVNGSAPVQPPATPSLASPANASTGVATTVTLQWNSSASATGYDLQVSTSSAFTTLFVSRTGLAQTSSSVSGLTASTLYYWRVRATNSGGSSAWTTAWSFTTAALPSDTTPPAVSITSPVAGASVSGTSAILASASDNVGVVGVRFYADGTAIGQEVTAAPYQVSWNTTLATNGTHSLTAVARDLAGNSKTSTAVSVTVSNSQDVTPPVVSINSPASGASLTGTSNIVAVASDNVGVVGVRFYINGSSIGQEVTATPYQVSWNTTQVANGNYDLTAVARDLAGNSKTSSVVTVSVANPVDTTLEVSAYTDTLQRPWINSSWSSVVSFSNAERVFEGAKSIKSVSSAWGALRIRSGSWSSPVPVNTVLFDKVEFAVYNTTPGLDISVRMENDAGSTFPATTYTDLTLNQWVLLSIPVAQLNPGNYDVHSLTIQNNTTGSATLYVDEIRFVAPAKGSMPPSPPVLSSPVNGATGQTASPTLAWAPVTDALTYDIQVSPDANFASFAFQQTGLTSASVNVPALQAGILYYWRVRGVNAAGAGVYSAVFHFSTLGVNRVLLYSRTSIDFGRVAIGSSKRDSVRLNNGGIDPITLSAITSTNAAITTSMQSPTISAGGLGYIYFTFRPTVRATIAASTIIVHDGTNSPDTIAINARGVNPPRLHTSATLIDFGVVTPGAQRVETLIVRNEGELDLEFSDIQSTNPVFRASASMTLVAPGDSTAIEVLAQPQAPTMEQGYLLIYSNAQEYPESIHVVLDGSMDIGGGPGVTPQSYSLGQNYPNPFNPTTMISFALPLASTVKLAVFNAIGQEVSVVMDQTMAEGTHQVLWNGLDSRGNPLGSGVYFYRISAISLEGRARTFTETRKMILAK
jgi:GH18 family chitinase